MKLVWYECKKICNLKLILFLIAFTFLFYNLFIRCTIHPEDNAGCVASDDLVDILQNEYGYDTILLYEDFSVLEEIRLKQVEQLDKLVRASEVLSSEGITSWEQLRNTDYEDLTEEANDARSDISFGSGQRQVFLVQHIEHYYDIMKYNPIMGIEDGKEFEAAKTFQSHTGNRNASDAVISLIAKYMENDQLSLLPNGVVGHTSLDFPKIGILMIISCLVLILPYPIRERLSGVIPLHKTTQTGRNLWKTQYGAVILSCTLVCLVQLLVFGIQLQISGILRYFHFPINGNGYIYHWIDTTFGMYLLANGIFYTLIALGSATIFFLMSRVSSNYIIGIAIGIPVTILLGTATYMCMRFFLQIRNGFVDLLPYLSLVLLLSVSTWFICFMINRSEQRRDILL